MIEQPKANALDAVLGLQRTVDRVERESSDTVDSMVGWQPLTTAPKDGSMLLLRHKNDTPFVGYWYATEQVWRDPNCGVRQPTQWAPLPPNAQVERPMMAGKDDMTTDTTTKSAIIGTLGRLVGNPTHEEIAHITALTNADRQQWAKSKGWTLNKVSCADVRAVLEQVTKIANRN